MLRRDAQSDRPILVAEPLDERMKRQHRHLSAIEKVASMLRRRLGSREGCEYGGCSPGFSETDGERGTTPPTEITICSDLMRATTF